jgi:hypothetical protein
MAHVVKLAYLRDFRTFFPDMSVFRIKKYYFFSFQVLIPDRSRMMSSSNTGHISLPIDTVAGTSSSCSLSYDRSIASSIVTSTEC